MKTYLLRRICGAFRRLEFLIKGIRLNLEETATWCSSEEQQLLDGNITLLNRHRGSPCFIIGNGPSLTKQNLNPLAGQVTFVMSGFWKHPVVKEWQPTYYCFADPLFFDGSNAMTNFFRELTQHVQSAQYLLPLSGRNAVVRQGLIGQAQAYYVSFQGGLDHCRSNKVNLCGALPGVMSVAQFAMLGAIYMGCRPIYLLGLDHDWLAQRGADRHFYAGKTVEGHAKAHGNLDEIPYKEDLENVLKLWKGYERLRTIAKNNDTEIFNATAGGFLDIFPRVTYENISHKL